MENSDKIILDLCGGTGSWSRPPEYAHLGLDRAAIRAITPPGFSRAFYKANK